MDQSFKIAQVSAAHGIRGELKIFCYLENPRDITRYNPLLSKQGKPYSLRITGQTKDHLIAAIDGITDRNEAELLRGLELYATAEKLPKKNEGEYFQHELVGHTIVDASGAPLGKVIAFHNFGAGDIIEFSSKDGEMMLPFKAPFIGDIDMKNATIQVNMPDYIESKKS